MPRRDLTLAEKLVSWIILNINNKNTDQRRLEEITGLAKIAISPLIRQENRHSAKARIQISIRPSMNGLALLLLRGVRVSGPTNANQKMLLKSWVTMTSKLGKVGCIVRI
ncbi:hypothetical protein ACOME3_008193 [Neoechinorhynchus agilis]